MPSKRRLNPTLMALAAVVAAVPLSNERVQTGAPVGQPTGPPQQSFGLLRRDRTADDALSASDKRQLSTLGVPLDSARAVDVGKQNNGWVLASDSELCIAVPSMRPGHDEPGYGTSCGPSTAAQTDGLTDTRLREGASKGGPMEDFGLVPDGVEEVRVQPQGSAARTVPVRGNVVHVDARVGDTVSFTDAGGRHELVGERP